MKAIICPQCGSLIRDILPHQPLAECDYCGAKIIADEQCSAPEPFDREAAKFRALERPAPPPRPPIQPIFIAISGIGIFMFVMFLLSLIPLKTQSAAPSPPELLKPVTFPTPKFNSDDIDRTASLNPSKILTLSYCDLIKNAAEYDKKIVRVRAIYLNEFERTNLYDDRCKTNQTPTAPNEFPAETWAEWDKTLLMKGDSDEAKLNLRLNGFGRKDVTVVGRFYSTGEKGDRNAANRFGHLNCCRFKFSIMRVENVVELENKTVKNSNEYGKIVKFAPGQQIEFADFSLEYIADLNLIVEKTMPNQKLPKYAFKAGRGGESVMIYGSSEPNDNTPLTFEFGEEKYFLQSGISDKSGRLAKDELIVQRIG